MNSVVAVNIAKVTMGVKNDVVVVVVCINDDAIVYKQMLSFYLFQLKLYKPMRKSILMKLLITSM